MSVVERLEALAHHLIGPLVLGGAIQLERPFGARLALELGTDARIVDNELAVAIDNARLRVARMLVPMDAIPPLGPAEWSIAAAFNDLLQVTNHELSGFITRGRHQDLLAAVVDLCARIPRCATLEEAVCRHATFSRALEVFRTDTRLSWWTGSASFRGQAPPPRLLAWPELRRVQVHETRVFLVDMAEGIVLDAESWLEAVGRWLSLSPLSDVARAARPQPAFAWSAETLGVVATVAGRNLALRAVVHATDLDRAETGRAIQALTASAADLPAGSLAQTSALALVDDLQAALGTWSAGEVA